jgi:predicted amidohydrolase
MHVHESELPYVAPGDGGALVAVENRNVALAICFDATFASHAADAAARGAQVYAASVMIDEAGYERKSAYLEGYARRYGLWVLMANYAGTGRSRIWTPGGRVAAEAGVADPALIFAEC